MFTGNISSESNVVSHPLMPPCRTLKTENFDTLIMKIGSETRKLCYKLIFSTEGKCVGECVCELLSASCFDREVQLILSLKVGAHKPNFDNTEIVFLH